MAPPTNSRSEPFFQVASPFPTLLGTDDLAIAHNQPGTGIVEQAINRISQNRVRLVLIGSGLWILNSTSKQVGLYGIAGANDVGSWEVWDSAEANNVILSAAATAASATAGAAKRCLQILLLF